MTFYDRLLTSFPIEPKPGEYIASPSILSDANNDVLSFIGMNWIDVPKGNWKNHGDALFGFAPDSFVYYLPSLLDASFDICIDDFLSPWNLFQILNTSGDPKLWDVFFLERFLKLTRGQLCCLCTWAESIISNNKSIDSIDSERVLYTIFVVQSELSFN